MQEYCPDYHFIAIGGIGQSALAKILLEEGYKVSGSDISKSKYVKKLEDLGAKIYIGHSERNLCGKPTIVLSSAIKQDNPELVKAKKIGLKIIHRSDLLKSIAHRYPCFMGFSGTHGKTTTSGMCAYVLSKAGKKPAYAVGGIIPDLNTNGACEDKNTPYFAAELDESDGTILKYSPKITLINNLEADHLDFYVNGLEDILKTFSTFLSNLDPSSIAVVNIDNEANLKLIEKNPNFKNFVSVSLKDDKADYCAKNIVFEGLGSSFDVYHKGLKLGSIKLSLPGIHNISNALGVTSVLMEAGFEFSEFAPHFETFSGMGRRFQLCAEFGGIKVIDDYAHHPTEISATLNALRHYDKGRVVAIFQPHRYSRFQGLYNNFLSAFKDTDFVAVLDVYAAGENKPDGLSVEDFAADLNKSGTEAEYFKGSIDMAAREIIKYLKPNDIVLTFGAGDITKMGTALNELYSLIQ